ncbi:MAG: DUF2333 family protein, partial [Desulfobacterota bacterium]|nr:DUF2333 family protein [Thermodesulfobacteriota bacterium]
AGLRSHIMQVLLREEVERERTGVLEDGIRHFPEARPLKMLRIFRTRFKNRREAEEELARFKIVETYLAPLHMARSNEFLVDFEIRGRREPMLCGLQEYMEGETINPWNRLGNEELDSLRERMRDSPGMDSQRPWVSTVRDRAGELVQRLKELISKAGYVPDLAGSGNLILTPSGRIKLVDINNISRISPGSSIPLDDRGYPVCDKSVEALSRLEKNLAGHPPDPEDKIYEIFLDPVRMEKVRALETQFHRAQAE